MLTARPGAASCKTCGLQIRGVDNADFWLEGSNPEKQGIWGRERKVKIQKQWRVLGGGEKQS